MLRTRVIVGVLLGATAFGLFLLDAWLSGWGSQAAGLQRWLTHGAIGTAVTLVFCLLLVHELLGLARRLEIEPLGRIAYIFSAGLVLAPFLAHNQPYPEWRSDSWGMAWLALAIGLSFWLQAWRRGTHHVLMNVATTTFIIGYAGGLLGFAMKLRFEIGGPTGMYLLLAALLVTKMTDTGAYFTGMLLGRHKMIEWLSPKKTWEGFAGGMIFAVATAVLTAYLFGLTPCPFVFAGVHGPAFPWSMMVYGVVMALVAVGGDLAGSLLKRDAAVKDSGVALPGLGGILDVLDSPLLTMPVAWFFWTRLLALPPAAFEAIAAANP